MESADGQVLDRTRHQFVQALHHLFGGLIRKSHGQDPPRAHPHRFDQISHPLGDDAGLAGAGPGQNQHRAVDGLNGFLLF